MKQWLAVFVLGFTARCANAELTLTEIRTASPNVLVAYFKSTIVKADEVNVSNPSLWKLNGKPVDAINRFVTEADRCDHHIYLHVPTLVQGTRYSLETPHGVTNFVFDEMQKIKAPDTINTHAAKVMNGDFVVGMTGTPIENRIEDLWCVMDRIAPGSPAPLLGVEICPEGGFVHECPT